MEEMNKYTAEKIWEKKFSGGDLRGFRPVL